MKNTILSFLLILFTTNAFSQENPIIYFDYVTVLNTDVEKHIEAEKNVFSKMHKEQIDMGVKILQFNANTRKLRFINHTK